MTDAELARAIRDHIAENGDAAVDDLARELGESPGRVTFILDEYVVKSTGGVEHAGPGGGGGWVPPEE